MKKILTFSLINYDELLQRWQREDGWDRDGKKRNEIGKERQERKKEERSERERS